MRAFSVEVEGDRVPVDILLLICVVGLSKGMYSDWCMDNWLTLATYHTSGRTVCVCVCVCMCVCVCL